MLLAQDLRAAPDPDTSRQGLEVVSDNEIRNPDVGRRIGPYQLVREIGQGGMGTVYLARRSDGQFLQTVAIKLIRRGMDTESNLGRFRAERQILAHLNHPNIAALLDGGTTEDGRPYLVMEFIEGQPLLSYCRTQRLSLVRRLELFQQICSAAHYAHQKKIIHRDLKPGNVLVTTTGVPKLLDFGIAKLLMAEDLTETVTTVRVLTPSYASPEQVCGQRVSIATDVYLLGLLLYELVAGEHPFRRAGRTHEEVERAICHETPVPLSEKAGVEDREFIQAHLDAIVAKALQKAPELRYADAQQLFADIAGSLQEPKSPAEIQPGLLRRRSVIYSLAALGLATTLFTVIPFRRTDTYKPASSLLVLPFANLTGDPRIEHFADGLTEEITTELARLPQLRVPARTTASQFKGKAMDIRAVGRELGVAEVLEGSVRTEGDRVRITAQLIHVADGYHTWAETYERTLENSLLIQREISRDITVSLEARLAGRTRWRGRGQATPDPQALSDYVEAYRLLDWDKLRAAAAAGIPPDLWKAIGLLERAIGRDAQFAQAWAGLADVCEIATSFDQRHAATMKARAMAAALRALELDDTLADAHAVLGTLRFFHEWDFAGAEASLRRAVEINPRVIPSLQQYADLLRLFGRHEESAAILSHAEVLAPSAPEIAVERGLLLYSRKQYQAALRHAERAGILRANYPQSLWLQGLCLERLACWAQAEEKYRRALELSSNDSRALPALGYLLGKTGRKAEALVILERLTQQNNNGPARGYSIALVYAGLGDVQRALDSLELAYKQHDSSMPYLNVEQRFETLAPHPRFRALIARMNLTGVAVTK